jgi:hypothetical protein
MLYEAVPLFLVPRSFAESALLLGLSYLCHHLTELMAPQASSPAIEVMNTSGQMIVLLMYLPVTVMVLRRRNEVPRDAKVGTVALPKGRPIRQFDATALPAAHPRIDE